MKTLTKTLLAIAFALPFVNAKAEDYGFGDMGGVFNVSESGAATYTQPFDLPEGINGMQPSLGLVYNSQSGNGVAGMGVSIYGTSVITRTAKDIYHNGTAKGISYTDNDAYCLDGVRLIDIAQNDYRPENSPADYFTKTTNGFKTELQNGRTAYYEYKATANGVAYAWYLNKVEDKWGNVMYYSYSTFNGCVYLTQVQYGTNLGASTGLSNIVTFGYDTRNDVMPYVVNGTKCSMGRRLTSVTIKTNSVERNKYTLTYSNTDAFSRLTKVEESYGTTKLPPVTLGWKNIPALSITPETISSESGISQYAMSGKFVSADLTGDGLSDIVQITEGGGSMNVSIYSASVSNGTATFTRVVNSVSISAPSSSPVAVGDMDGNGVAELLAIKAVSTSSSEAIASISNKTRVVTLATESIPKFAVGNFYNNGKTDIVYVKENGNNYRCRILNLNGSSTRKADSYLTIDSEPMRLFAGDFNSDGMSDLVVFHENGYIIFWNQGVTEGNSPFSDSKKTTGSSLKYASMTQIGDFNGDGLIDFLTNATNDKNWYFFLNNGNGTFSKTTAISDGVYDYDFTDKDNGKFSCHVLDFDFDGKQDIVITKAIYHRKTNLIKQEWGVYDYTTTQWYRSNGSSLSLVKTATSKKDTDAQDGRFLVGDFNGDGYTELMNYGYDCYGSTDANVEPSWRIYRNPSVTAATNKLTSISVGQSGTYTSISYSTLSDASVYTKGSSSTYPLATLCVPMSVVKQVYQNLAYNTYYTNYKYTQLRAHLKGRGLLGFTTVEASNSTTGEKRTTTVNSLHSTFYEPSKITTTITKDGKTDVTETTLTAVSYMGKPHLTYPSIIKNTDIYNLVTTTTNEYYSIYYPTKQRTEYGNNANMYKQVEYSDYKRVGGVYKPQTVVTTQKHKDDANAFTTKTTYTYDAKGNPTKMVENAATVPVTHEYTYSGLGNMLTHKVSATGITTVTTTLTYDATNRFVASEKSSANSLITNYTYNNLGRLTQKQEGVSGSLLTTSYTYDAIGNITKITHPDNTTTTYTRSWGTMPYRRNSVITKTTGQAATTTWYDNLGREVETTSTGEKGVSLTSTKSYNTATGQLYSHNNKIGGITISETRGYNKLGQLTSVSSNSGKKITYSYSARSVTSTQSGINYILQKNFDAWGNTTHVNANGCTSTTYKYSSNGQPISVRYGDASYQDYMASTMTYDSRGQQTSLTDIDAGKTSYEYDALGRVTKQTDARGNITTNTYNASGLLTTQVCGGVTTTYSYDSRLRLTKESTGSQSIAYEYDDKNRLTKKSYSIDGASLSYSYVYNSYGQMTAQTFPDGMTENYTYDSYGNLATIKIGGQRVWELNSYNGTQRTAYLGTAPLILTKNYSAKGLLTGTSVKKGSTSLHSFGYTFDGATGNLTQRTGMNGTETFKYDQFDRLNTGTSYALNGNIASKTGIGKYTYDTGKKNAVVQVENTDNLIQGAASLTYNAFNKVATVVQGTNTLTITYGPDRQRTKTVLVNGSNTTTTLYADNYEQRTVNGTTTTYHYVASPDGLIAVYVKKNGTTTPYYVETDHLGSIINLFDASGTKQFSATYDAWGKQTITKNAIGLTRGYTGHEHWPQFGLIDMNGRFYDPLLGRFLSPDPYVQAPDNPQNYNRYSYCLNNPLKYTDPTGEYFGIDDLIAGAIGGTVNLVVNAIQGNLGGHGVWGGIGRGFAAFGAGAVGGVGALYPEFGGWAWGGAAVGATNAWLGGATTFDDIFVGAGVGAVAGMVGGAAGQWATTATSPLVSSISSPVARSTVSGIIGGAAGGYAGGFVGGYFMTGDISAANKAGLSGMWTSAGIGGVAGGFAGYRYAKAHDLNPWTGHHNRVDFGSPLAPKSPSSLDPVWEQAPCLRGVAIETLTMDKYYCEWEHTPYAPVIDGISPNGEVVSIKSNYSESGNMAISKSIKNLKTYPASTKILHVVTPPGYVPKNWGNVIDFCESNGIIVRLTHY